MKCFFCGEVLANNDHAMNHAGECPVMNSDPDETVDEIVSRPTRRTLDLAITCEKCGSPAKYPVCECGNPIPRPPNH